MNDTNSQADAIQDAAGPPQMYPKVPSPHAVGAPWVISGLFVASGAAALMYEVIWLQLLRYSVGGSAVSLAVTLASFMGGLGLGAWVWPKLICPSWHPLWVYAGLELGIGAWGATMPWLIPWVSQVHTELGADTGGILGRALLCALCLTPPAALMGATLPAVARWVAATPSGMAWLGRFYAVNTAGAVAGTLMSAFVLMPNLTMGTATAVAVALSATVAISAGWLARRTPPIWSDHNDLQCPSNTSVIHAAAKAPTVARTGTANSNAGERGNLVPRMALLAILLSGATAMGCQVVWTRALSILLSVTVYTFALILAGFLTGLAIGAAIGAAVVRRTHRPGVMLALTLTLAVPSIMYAFGTIGHVVPGWDHPLRWFGRSVGIQFADDLLRIVVALTPATVCWGASMPLAIAAAGWGSAEQGRLLGRVYGLNTLGAISGVLIVGLILVPRFGSDWTAHALVALAALAAMVMAVAVHREPTAPMIQPAEPATLCLKTTYPQLMRWFGYLITRGLHGFHCATAQPAGIAVLLVAMAIAVLHTPGVPTKLLVSGKNQHFDDTAVDFVEGMHAPAAAMTLQDGNKLMFVSGKVVASTLPIDMCLQYMLGHVAAIAHGHPRSVLIIGLGTGTTAGCFVDHPSVERIVICEIEPRVVDLARTHFSRQNRDVLDNRRTRVIFDDARHYLAHTNERFDVITSDPIHPWVKGASVLYSRDYYDLVRKRLNHGGVVTQWVPLYETGPGAVRTMLATFFDAFPHGSIWHAGETGMGNDVVMLARPDAARHNLADWANRLTNNLAVRAALAEVGIHDPMDLYARFTGYAPPLSNWLRGTRINRDRSLRLEYLAGLSRRTGASATDSYRSLVAQRTFPGELFAAPAGLAAQLRQRYDAGREPNGLVP